MDVREGENFRFKINRLKKGETKTSWGSPEYIPTVTLYFKLDGYPDKEWRDGKLSLELQITDIVAKLETQRNEMLDRQIIWKNEREEREEVERIKKELEEQKKEDLSNFKNLLLTSKRWHKAVNLRLYIDVHCSQPQI